MSLWRKSKNKKLLQDKNELPFSEIMDILQNKKLNESLDENLIEVENVFKNDSDFSLRRFHLFGHVPAVALFISSIVDTEKINRDIIRPLQKNKQDSYNRDEFSSGTKLSSKKEKRDREENHKKHLVQSLLDDVLCNCDGETAGGLQSIIDALLRGKTVILLDKEEEALLLETFNPEKRGIEQPETERVVRGPRDGFIEQLQSNISLIRYRLPVPEFRVEPMEAGKKRKLKLLFVT